MDRDDKSNHGTPTQFMVLLWCLWLLGSWAVVRWQAPPMALERWMLLAAVVGLMVAWPAVRLSQRRLPVGRLGRRPGVVASRLRRQWQLMDLAVEWLCLALVFQAVVWPLSFVAHWGLSQTLWMNAAMLAWSFAAAALVAWGCVFAHGAWRGVAMAGCLLLLAGEPVVVALLTLVTSSWHGGWGVSPLPTLWVLSEPTTHEATEVARGQTTGMIAAVVAGWLLLALAARYLPAREEAAEDLPPLRSTSPADRS